MKKVLIILMILVVVPLLAMTALYFTVDPFREMANNVLAKLPGSFGEKFANIPGDGEIGEQIDEIADYLLSADTDRAVDKLLLAESNDKATYELLLKQMNRTDPNKTAKLLEAVRQSKLQESPIMDTLSKIKEEEEKEHKLSAEYLSGLSLSNQLQEVKKILDEEKDAHEKLAKVFASLPEGAVLNLLPLLKESDKDQIISHFEADKALNFKKKLKEKEERLDNIKTVAATFQPIEAKELAKTLGPDSAYEKEELAMIYTELGPKKAGEILSKVDDDVFVKDMLKRIRDRERLGKGEGAFSENLIESLNIYKKYDDKMDELVSIYMEMDEDRTAKMIKTLYLNASEPKVYPLKNGEQIVISDEDLALDLLRSFSYKKTAAILSHFDNRIASDIFTKLALPEPE
ncbi:MAG: hypothetical protein Q4A72_03930 [Bacillota bacterium]|nr:hypothetical protein [Bacillota bacterium]